MNLTKYFMYFKRLCKVYAVWPLEPSASKIWKITYQYLWWFYFLNHVFALIVTSNSCYQARNNVELFTFSFIENIAFMEVIIILINYKCHKNLIKCLLDEIEEYIEAADRDRKLNLKKRIPVYATMTSLIFLIYGVIITLHISNPVVTERETFFTTAYYPSFMRSCSFDLLIYLHEIVVILHSSSMVILDIMVVTLLYGFTARLKILAAQFKEAKGYQKLIDCIREHQDCLIMAKEANKVVRFVVLKTVLCYIGYTVAAGLQVANPKATTLSLERFGAALLIHSIRLIMIAMSADDLSKSSQKIESTVYSTSWYEDDKKSVIAKKLIMLRCRNIVKISVPGFMPILSLSFITGIISTAISYFTTLRAVTRS